MESDAVDNRDLYTQNVNEKTSPADSLDEAAAEPAALPDEVDYQSLYEQTLKEKLDLEEEFSLYKSNTAELLARSDRAADQVSDYRLKMVSVVQTVQEAVDSKLDMPALNVAVNFIAFDGYR